MRLVVTEQDMFKKAKIRFELEALSPAVGTDIVGVVNGSVPLAQYIGKFFTVGRSCPTYSDPYGPYKGVAGVPHWYGNGTSAKLNTTQPQTIAVSSCIAVITDYCGPGTPTISISIPDTELATAKIAMVAAQAAEAAGKQSYLKAAAPWQKVQSQEAVAQKKYRADVQRLNKALKATAKDPHDSFAQDRVTDVEKRLHEDRKASRSDTIDLDNLGVLAGQQKLVQTVRKAEETLAAATSKFSDIMSKKGTASSRLEAELHKVADEKARIAADQRMLAHFKDLLATIDAQEGRETKQKLDVMSRINELVASAPVVVTAAAKPSVAKK